ncbi:transmembrane protein, putative, partial [Bodo saltans]
MERPARRSGSVFVTAAIGSVAVALACGAFLVKYLRGEAQGRKELEETPVVVEERGKLFRETHFAQVAMTHATSLSSTEMEWWDKQLGIRILFCPQTLALTHEERQHPLGMLKFVSCKEPDSTVQCVFEELSSATSAETYRRSCVEKISDVCQLISVDGWERFGSDPHPIAKYCYLSEADAIVNVLSVFLARENVALSIQFCTSRTLPSTLPVFVYELVRNTKFVAPQVTPSYLFCCEPRLGVGFRVPLGFVLDSEDNHGKLFASLRSGSTHTRVIGFHKEINPLVEWTRSLDDVLSDCSAFLGFARPIVTTVDNDRAKGGFVMRPCHLELPTSSVRFGGSDSEAQRTVQGYCCYHEVASMSSGEKSSYLCVYFLPIDANQCVALAFLCPRTNDKQQFIQFCQNVANSMSLGNHYGQETSLSYCCMRGLHKFHLSIGTQYSVVENAFSDPLCELKDNRDNSRLAIRMTSALKEDVENKLASWVRRLGGDPQIISITNTSLTSVEGTVVTIVHQHHAASFEDIEAAFDQNPLLSSSINSDGDT